MKNLYRLRREVTREDLKTIGLVTSFEELLKRDWKEGEIREYKIGKVVYFEDILWVPIELCESITD